MSMLEQLSISGQEALRKSIFHAGNPTPGTGLASKDAPTTFSALAGLINLFNQGVASDSANAHQNVWLIPIMMRLTARSINTSASDFRLLGVLDNVDRWASGGTELTPKSTSIDVPADDNWVDRTPAAKVYGGELTLAAANNAKTVFNVTLSKDIFAVGDSVEIWFGDGPGTSEDVKIVPMVQIGRGSNLSIHELATAQAADPAFEYEILWAEMGHSALT